MRSFQSRSREKVSAPITSARLCRAGTQEFFRRHDREDEAAADSLQIESDPLDDAERGLNLSRDRGKRIVGSRRGDDDEINVGRLEAAVAQRRLSRLEGQ